MHIIIQIQTLCHFYKVWVSGILRSPPINNLVQKNPKNPKSRKKSGLMSYPYSVMAKQNLSSDSEKLIQFNQCIKFNYKLGQWVMYRVSQNRMSFSRQLKMPEKRNLHNKTRLFYYQYIPPFRFIANNFIKICHKGSKFQNS